MTAVEQSDPPRIFGADVMPPVVDPGRKARAELILRALAALELVDQLGLTGAREVDAVEFAATPAERRSWVHTAGECEMHLLVLPEAVDRG